MTGTYSLIFGTTITISHNGHSTVIDDIENGSSGDILDLVLSSGTKP